jgi:hypothetical protein
MEDPTLIASSLPAGSEQRRLTPAKPTWEQDVIFICRKCDRKNKRIVEGQSLMKWLRKHARQLRGRDAFQFVEVDCFDLCPKRGVVLARGRELGDDKPLRVFRRGDDPRRLLIWLGGAETPVAGAAAVRQGSITP